MEIFEANNNFCNIISKKSIELYSSVSSGFMNEILWSGKFILYYIFIYYVIFAVSKIVFITSMIFIKVAGFEERIGNQFIKGWKEFNISADFLSTMTVWILQIPQLCTSFSFTLYLFLMNFSACYKIMFHTHQ
jgi:hypothetical protein